MTDEEKLEQMVDEITNLGYGIVCELGGSVHADFFEASLVFGVDQYDFVMEHKKYPGDEQIFTDFSLDTEDYYDGVCDCLEKTIHNLLVDNYELKKEAGHDKSH